MICIGACTFRELPVEYQQLFRTGGNRISEGVFVAEKYPAASVLMGLPLVWLFALIPAILIYDHGLSFGSLWGVLSLVLPLFMTGLTAKRIGSVIEVFRRRKAGDRIYGLVIDEQNVVSRKLHLLPGRNCVFIPRAQVDGWGVQKAAGHPSKYGRAAYLFVKYTDARGSRKSLKLAQGNAFELNPRELDDLFTALSRSIRGEWSRYNPDFKTHGTDTILRFDESNGTLTEVLDDAKIAEIRFTFRHTGCQRLSIESANGDVTEYRQVKPGDYRYEIRVGRCRDGKLYELIFDREFAGSPSRWYGPKVKT